jgi:O-acetylhomoserine (thiol)-lyase
MSDDAASWGFETRQIHAGTPPETATGARAVPIYQTTSFQFPDADVAAARFDLADLGFVYTRIGNPTQGALEARLNALEGGVVNQLGIPGTLAVSSGQAAQTLAILNLAESGDHLVSSASLYGGTYNLFHYTLPKAGIEVTFVNDPADLDEWRAAVRPDTKAFYGETLPNPKNDVLDIEAVADAAHAEGIPLMVDNTVPTPYLIRPLEWGADIVVHSLTKFLGGHGTSIGGAIVDGGTFDFGASGRFPSFTEPDPSYHGLAYWPALGPGAYIVKARVQLLRDIGAAISPFNAFLILQGIETLSLRMERHFANAQAVAQYLEARSDVLSINYAGLPESPSHKLALKYGGGRGFGSVLAFEIAGGLEAGKRFVEALTLHSHVANIGDVRSLVIHPASTTHRQLTPEEQELSAVTAGLVRLSVGLESIDDILADLDRGFAAAAG